MKTLWKLNAMVLCILLVVGMLGTTVSAAPAGREEVTYFEDGSYLVTVTETQSEVQSRAGDTTLVGSKKHKYYNSADEILWTFSVRGTFVYNGTTVRATDASYFYSIYNSAWSFVSASASYSGATATATGKFKHAGITSSTTIKLTCSPTGVLS